MTSCILVLIAIQDHFEAEKKHAVSVKELVVLFNELCVVKPAAEFPDFTENQSEALHQMAFKGILMYVFVESLGNEEHKMQTSKQTWGELFVLWNEHKHLNDDGFDFSHLLADLIAKVGLTLAVQYLAEKLDVIVDLKIDRVQSILVLD